MLRLSFLEKVLSIKLDALLLLIILYVYINLEFSKFLNIIASLELVLIGFLSQV